MDLLDHGERERKVFFKTLPEKINNFFRDSVDSFRAHADNSDDIKNLFDKAFAYWIYCSLRKIPINQNNYGFLKSKLNEFSKGLLRKILSIAQRVASKVIAIKKIIISSRS